VLAVDIGSTASRGDVYDAAGRPVQGGREKVPHQFTTRDDGTSEIDPDQIVGEVQQIITALATDRRAGRIGGVALDTFASSLVGVSADRRACTPCFTYADSRCAAQVGELRRELDERVIQQRTGCRLHASYLTARLRSLRDTMPDTFRSVRHWMSLGEYIYLQIVGTTAAGTSTAAWTGMLDRRTGQWDQELLDVCGVREEQLSEIRDPDQPITEVDAAVRRRWPALAGAAWFPVVSDGFSSNMGAGLLMSRPSPPPLPPVVLCGFSCTASLRKYRLGSGAIASMVRARCWVALSTMWAVLSAGCSPRCGSYPRTTSS
jgi:gluconokinase